MAMFDETEKRFDRRQSRIAGTDGIGTSLFDMFEERPDRLNVEVFDEKFRWGSPEPPGDKPQQEGESTGIGRDGMSALRRIHREDGFAGRLKGRGRAGSCRTSDPGLLGGRRNHLQKNRRSLKVPVGVGDIDMAEIGAQSLHVPQHCLRVVPAGLQGSHGEGVAQIMQPGAGPCRIAVAKLPDDPNEDHMGPCFCRGMTMTKNEEIVVRVTHGRAGFEISFQRGTGRSMYWHETTLTKFAAPDHEALRRKIVALQGQCLGNPQARRSEQP